MLDFTELDTKGDSFELLIRELLYNRGLEVYWSGKGTDGGKDLLCIEKNNSCFKTFNKRWIVQCKHNAHSQRAVGLKDVESSGGIENLCDAHNATGYILVCSTFPSSTVVDTLERIEENKGITTACWDCVTLEKELLTPRNWSLVSMFFPESSKKIGWKIDRLDDQFWYAYYKGFSFFISLRLGVNCQLYLGNIAELIEELRGVEIPSHTYLRLRAINFDEKNCNYIVYLDYITSQKDENNYIVVPESVEEFCYDRCIKGATYDFDLKVYFYDFYSDHFDQDHVDYYDRYKGDYQTGYPRFDRNSIIELANNHNFLLTENEVNDSFIKLVDTFKKIPYIKVLRCTNAKIEQIHLFSDTFTWANAFAAIDFSTDNLFKATIRFEAKNFKKVYKLIEQIPQSIMQHIGLRKDFVITSDTGYEKKETVYTLDITIFPCCSSVSDYRKKINSYYSEIEETIIKHLEENDI